MPIIFIFLDGVGIAPDDPRNPFARAETPTIRALLSGPLTREQAQQRKHLLLKPIDATLGVAGLPQSGTGHVALLAGVNAPALVNRHQSHFPPVALRPLLAERSIFRQAQELGSSATFANAFTPGYWQALANRRLRRSASVIAAEGAGLRFRDLDDWQAERAVTWDITGEALQDHGVDIESITPQQAGERLVRLSHTYDLVFFECFLPDLVGHGRLPTISAEMVIHRIDAMLSGLLSAKHADQTLVLTSDHGNIEDQTTSVHTYNPVPLLVVGPAATEFTAVADITDVADGIIAALR